MTYDFLVSRDVDGKIEWSIHFGKGQSDTEKAKILSVAQNFLGMLPKLEVPNDASSNDYRLTRMTRGELITGHCLTGSLYVEDKSHEFA